VQVVKAGCTSGMWWTPVLVWCKPKRCRAARINEQYHISAGEIVVITIVESVNMRIAELQTNRHSFIRLAGCIVSLVCTSAVLDLETREYEHCLHFFERHK
jgi:hypothetical protein